MSSLLDTPSGSRLRIVLLGYRNAGKSSLLNAIANQSVAIVNETRGTTTDPVQKNMEVLPLGPVTFIDTPGLDDDDPRLGAQRVEKAWLEARKADAILYVYDASIGLSSIEEKWLDALQKEGRPVVLVANKADKASSGQGILVSAQQKTGIDILLQALMQILHTKKEQPFLRDLLQAKDRVLLVVPIDESAPKDRLILPQQIAIRDVLDAHALCHICQVDEVKDALKQVEPTLVVTDSQAFKEVSALVPERIPLTSFSILMARYKSDLPTLLHGAKALDAIDSSDRILIAEGCTHKRQCNDIGTVKLPHWIKQHTKCTPQFDFCSGVDFPKDLSPYALIVHCGGCMLNSQEVNARLKLAKHAGIPITNYGMAIAHMHGILQRSIAPLGLF